MLENSEFIKNNSVDISGNSDNSANNIHYDESAQTGFESKSDKDNEEPQQLPSMPLLHSPIISASEVSDDDIIISSALDFIKNNDNNNNNSGDLKTPPLNAHTPYTFAQFDNDLSKSYYNNKNNTSIIAVSYTHLTLPTILLV